MGAKPISLPQTVKTNAASRVAEIATNTTGLVFISDHCEQRMIERGITRRQVMRVLREGVLVGNVHWNDHIDGGWKMRLKRISAGAEIVVIAKLIDKDGECVVAITTFEDQ